MAWCCQENVLKKDFDKGRHTQEKVNKKTSVNGGIPLGHAGGGGGVLLSFMNELCFFFVQFPHYADIFKKSTLCLEKLILVTLLDLSQGRGRVSHPQGRDQPRFEFFGTIQVNVETCKRNQQYSHRKMSPEHLDQSGPRAQQGGGGG